MRVARADSTRARGPRRACRRAAEFCDAARSLAASGRSPAGRRPNQLGEGPALTEHRRDAEGAENLEETVTLEDVLAARRRIADGVYFSPCTESGLLSELAGCRVWCKLDYLQRTGSFKERGARNAL